MTDWCLAHPWMTFVLAYVLFDSVRVVVRVRGGSGED
jgi:hypothetical protein